MFMKQYQLSRRAEEELHRVANKMQRVPHSFGAIARQWQGRANAAETPGHRAYAYTQQRQWHYRAISAQKAFDALLSNANTAPPTDLPLERLLMRPEFKYQ
jgi:hypothetical protein